MALTQAEKAMVEKALATGSGNMAVPLTQRDCLCLIAVIASDLGVYNRFPFLPDNPPNFFTENWDDTGIDTHPNHRQLLAELREHSPDSISYFACLASLLKSRKKYDNILKCQPVPTMDQVGPRALLQYGTMSPRMLAHFLLWRKWLFDLDNRSGQETGYLFEPIIAHAIGGTPVSAAKSPIKRHDNNKKGRQVDCIKGALAYEFKIRLTIAASGQGRWGEELAFPVDCRMSGYQPVLVVLDPTENPKLTDLIKAFEGNDGLVFVGENAWKHLEQQAGETMAIFLEKYVKVPLQEVIGNTPVGMGEITMRMEERFLSITVEGETYAHERQEDANAINCDGLSFPIGIEDEIPGP
ncbi:MAG: restriction endonuclease [Proteobacteria bacterium]|nr:restriction endonuclease [Pseudomonadota bacterium]